MALQLAMERRDSEGSGDVYYDTADLTTVEKIDDAIFTCKFPGCTRQYASTDGVRKHCRKSHPEWLKEVDLEKAANGCRWAAYCTREAITEGSDPRTTPVGSKRAREIIAAGGVLPNLVGDDAVAAARAKAADEASRAARSSGMQQPADLMRIHNESGSLRGGGASHPAARHVSISIKKVNEPSFVSIGTAMDGKSALRAPAEKRAGPAAAAALQEAASRENMLPPEMVSVPSDLNSPLPSNTSSLTPNAQARQRLGEIADGESSLLLGQGHFCPTSLPSPLCDASHPVPAPGFGFFVQWSMPPLKRGRSLADTKDAAKLQEGEQTDYAHDVSTDGSSLHHDSPSFLDSVLA